MIKTHLRQLAMISRVLAAVLGGYTLASATAVCFALVLPMARSEAVLTGIIVSFIVYVCAVLWVFTAANAWRAWLGLFLPGLLLGGTVLLVSP